MEPTGSLPIRLSCCSLAKRCARCVHGGSNLRQKVDCLHFGERVSGTFVFCVLPRINGHFRQFLPIRFCRSNRPFAIDRLLRGTGKRIGVIRSWFSIHPLDCLQRFQSWNIPSEHFNGTSVFRIHWRSADIMQRLVRADNSPQVNSRLRMLCFTKKSTTVE